LILLVIWGVLIVYGTWLPFDFSATSELVEQRLGRLWEQPWRVGSRADLITNVLLFMPWGFLLAIWRAGRGTSCAASVLLATLTGSLLSAGVEIGQLYAPSRTPSVVDLAANTLGSILGALIGWAAVRRAWPEMEVRLGRMVAERPMAGCALAVAAGLVFAGLSPFDVSLDVDDLKAAVKKSRPIPFGAPLRGPRPPAEPWSWAGEWLTWTLAGGLLVLAARESGWHGIRAWSLTVALSGGLSLAIEVSQLLSASREVDMTSVALAVLGSALGAAPVVRSTSRDARRWVGPAIVIWVLVVALAAWTPPRFGWPEPPFLRPERVVPFWAYYIRTDRNALADLINQVLAFIPLGALLAAWSWRRSFAGGLVIGLGCGFVLEFGQVFLPDRTADLTDVLTAAAGAGLGVVLWRWGESLRRSTRGIASAPPRASGAAAGVDPG
jgi:glycopeptide antibiotics resistance protein